jgi:hypothetical protein
MNSAHGAVCSTGADRTWLLSPSHFAFLWEEYPRCFYLHVAGGFQRPRAPFPKIFTVIDGHMKMRFTGTRVQLPDLPPGVVVHPDLWVASEPLVIPGHSTKCVLRGRLDNVIAFDDGTYAVLDGKTCSVRDAHVALYGRQLHAYAYCLEHPAPSKPRLVPVTRLGLLVFEPGRFLYPTNEPAVEEAALTGAMRWIDIPRDDAAFVKFLDAVLTVLEQPTPPAAASDCKYCEYRSTSRRTGV